MKPEVHVSMPCPICGMGETGTHNHYGGRACTSCRAFFRRSVQTNSYKVPHNCNHICNINLFNVDNYTLYVTTFGVYYLILELQMSEHNKQRG